MWYSMVVRGMVKYGSEGYGIEGQGMVWWYGESAGTLVGKTGKSCCKSPIFRPRRSCPKFIRGRKAGYRGEGGGLAITIILPPGRPALPYHTIHHPFLLNGTKGCGPASLPLAVYHPPRFYCFPMEHEYVFLNHI